VPTRPPRPCTTCRSLTHTTTGRCPTCEAEWQARRNQQRAQRYSAEYRRNRAELLQDHPPCRWCGQPATTADHVNGDDPDHLVPACQSCNSRRITRP